MFVAVLDQSTYTPVERAKKFQMRVNFQIKISAYHHFKFEKENE